MILSFGESSSAQWAALVDLYDGLNAGGAEHVATQGGADGA